MASNPSQNLALELMTTGEKSGQWGDITNINMQIVDRATKGVGTITLTTTSYSLDTVDYTPSDGHYAVLVFAGTPGGTCTVTINPNDQQKVFIVRNTTPSSVVLTQGSGGNVTIPTGRATIVYATGTGSGAAVVDITPLLGVLRPSNNLSDVANVATARTNLGVVIGTDVLAFDSNLQSFVTAFTLPTTDGTNRQTITTNASGTLAFTTLAVNDLSDGRTRSSSVGVGSGALAAETGSGGENTAFGTSALANLTTNSSNVAIGNLALSLGNPNATTAVGAKAGEAGGVSRGSFFGFEAGADATGSDNTAIGYLSLRAVSGNTGARNTVLGAQSARTLTSGNNNVLLGADAGFVSADPKNLTTGSNNILIGYQAMASSATVSNEITIGNSSHNVVRFPGTTVVGSLPSASTVGAGARSFVTDATATTFASIVAGGGANGVPVYSDGTNWRIG